MSLRLLYVRRRDGQATAGGPIVAPISSPISSPTGAITLDTPPGQGYNHEAVF
jgi:hypothetical protein